MERMFRVRWTRP